MSDGEDLLAELEGVLGHSFAERSLLEAALNHSSYANETLGVESNERLEFLGDAVIGLVVGHLLYAAHPSWAEGDLTRGLHKLVDRRALAKLGRDLDLGRFVRLGRTERRSGGDAKVSILADAVEAVFGAMYLDAGLEPIENLARERFAEALREGAERVERDPKTQLQEQVMAAWGVFPTYEVVRDLQVEGHEERFTVRVRVQGEIWGEGTARSKKTAERAAAKQALSRPEAVSGA